MELKAVRFSTNNVDEELLEVLNALLPPREVRRRLRGKEPPPRALLKLAYPDFKFSIFCEFRSINGLNYVTWILFEYRDSCPNASIFQSVCLMYPCPGSSRPPATPQRAASPHMPGQAPPAASAVPRGRVGKPVVLSLWVFHGDYGNPLLSFLGVIISHIV